MSSRISSDLLNDTYNLVQLARETALARGKQDQAQRLAPVADNLRSLVNNSRQTPPAQADSGVMGQSDFQTLLSAVQSRPRVAAASGAPSERNQVISSMADGGMSEVDIARYMGITREEVRLVVNIQGKGTGRSTSGEVLK